MELRGEVVVNYKRNLSAVAVGDPRYACRADGNLAARLAEHDFCIRRRDCFAEQTKMIAVRFMTIRPLRKLVRRRHVADIRRAAAHDEAKHHLRVVVFIVKRMNHQKFL